jgi:uncharacterized protein (DUF362 family)/Pyruvate/2-oxoacid:ferredoxin oxidoreductase delta subunit
MSSSVSLVKCEDYDKEKVLSGLRRAISLIGGIEKFVKKDDRVLLKPNLLYGKAPEKAVTTHPAIIEGVIQIVREAGGVPSLGDSPGIGGLVRAAEKAGIKKVATEMDCPLIEFNRPSIPSGNNDRFFKQLEIDQAVFVADVVINLPKWKTHTMMLLTLGVKNLFGCVPGPKKPLWHLKAGDDRKRFARVLVDLYQTIRPPLTILDGIVGMEGNGPGSGNPISLGLIVAGDDALSLDQIVCDLLKLPRETLLTNRVAFEQGLGKEGIDLFGERPGELNLPRFKLPALSEPDWNLPGFLKRALKNALTSKPVVEKEICSICNRCVEICPPKILKRKDEELVFDYGKCIRCFCCQEICPEGAITVKPGWTVKMFGRKP